MDLGWKTIAGGVLIGLGQLASAAITDCPVPTWVPWLKWFSGLFNAGGVVLGAVGISSKVATVTNSITRALDINRDVIANAVGKQRTVVQQVEKRVPYIVRKLEPGDSVEIKKPDGSTNKL
jgi:hypothetical protein